MRARHALAAAAALMIPLGPLAVAPANAVHDTTPPTLNTPALAKYVTGGTLVNTPIDGTDFFDVPMTFSWSATDDVAVVAYYVVRNYYAGSEPSVAQDGASLSFTGWADDYSDEFGGGSFDLSNWSVTATDGSNSVERAVYGASPRITQESGFSTGAGTGPSAGVSYIGSWGSSRCTCFAGGATRKTSASGARADIRVDISADRAESWVGLVMEKAANRGTFAVRVDGTRVAVVDTGSAATQHEVIVWQTHLGVGAHTISLINRATPGRPRIDLDAVVTN